MNAVGEATEVAMIPYQELDSFLSELSDDFDFAIGEMEVHGARHVAHELGALAKKKVVPKKLPVKATVKPGIYGRVTPNKQKPKSLTTPKKPAAKSAIQKHAAAGKNVAILARPKPHKAAEGPVSVSAMYSQLKDQGKVLNLMKVKQEATAEHKNLMAQDAFRKSVMGSLKAIDKRICQATTPGDYKARWNRLKIATGAW
jgi:hypothetical protein